MNQKGNAQLIIILALVALGGVTAFYYFSRSAAPTGNSDINLPAPVVEPNAPTPEVPVPVQPPAPSGQAVPPPTPAAASKEYMMHLTASGYDPKNITIRKGDTIKFINVGTEDQWPASNVHPTHEIYSQFDSKKPITPGNSWTFTFDKVGIWRYHDHIFPQIGGTITVTN